MLDYDAIILSGASGAVGSFLVRELTEHWPQKLICILREPSSMDRLRKAVGDDMAARVIPVYADLTKDEDAAAAQAAVGAHHRCLAIHCAGDVSWTKSQRLVGPINIDGTRRFAQLAVEASRNRPAIIFLSTAFCSDDAEPRNAYEATKLQAERMLLDDFSARAYLATIRCSLVVGSQSDGWIARFNGLYPMMSLIAMAEVPCLIAERTYTVDTVPIDIVWREIELAARQLSDADPVLRLIVASGNNAIRLAKFAEITSARVNDTRAAAGLGALPQISIISERQFRFLMKASKSWDMEQQFSKVEQISDIMAGYIAHGGSGRDIEPRLLGNAMPIPESYMPSVVDYWIGRNRSRALVDRVPEWLGEEQPA
ncbi:MULTISPECIES: SDR family oxidoreductase [unclassified Mesorhizobium]|uniref:SDR family oxidoreductase n=1 Tax=unclassified Mesorhizobium TaxID=325217 RepID=UPI000AC06147|nr:MULTISPECIES: SDR family oxidoreductase [unclassified Mesorhizobium]